MTDTSSYTDPRTWADGDYVSAATLNTQVRDNLRFRLGHSANPFPHARVRSATPVALASTQWSTLHFDTAVVDRGGMWLGAGSALVAPIAGRYRIGASLDTDYVASNKALRLIINASRVAAEKHRPGVGREAPIRATIWTSIDLEAGDFIEAEAWHDYPAPISAVPSAWAPVLWARWRGI